MERRKSVCFFRLKCLFFSSFGLLWGSERSQQLPLSRGTAGWLGYINATRDFFPDKIVAHHRYQHIVKKSFQAGGSRDGPPVHRIIKLYRVRPSVRVPCNASWLRFTGHKRQWLRDVRLHGAEYLHYVLWYYAVWFGRWYQRLSGTRCLHLQVREELSVDAVGPSFVWVNT